MSEIKPFFSVVIPLYNKEKYIKKTLESVLSQTFSNFEIIVVDDGSKDKSCEMVESIHDSRIRLIRQENGGPSKARNRGIQEAKGKFIAFLDADDEWLADKLEKQYELHSEKTEIVWSCSGYKIVGRVKRRTISHRHEGVLEDAIDSIVDGLPIWTSTVVIKKDIFTCDRLFFNESFMRSEDRELWYKLACIYPQVGYIDKILAIYNTNINMSLVNTAADIEDYSTLSMEERISNELNLCTSERRLRLIAFINKSNRIFILHSWVTRRTFSKKCKEFEKYIDKKLLNKLCRFSFIPSILKRIISKILISLIVIDKSKDGIK